MCNLFSKNNLEILNHRAMNNLYLCLVTFLFLINVTETFGQNFSWIKSEGVSSTDASKYIAKDDSGNLYIAGYFNGTFTIGSNTLVSSGNEDVFIAKYNSVGVAVRAIGIGSLNKDLPAGICIDSKRNIYVSLNWSASNSAGISVDTQSVEIPHQAGGNICLLLKLNPDLLLDWYAVSDSPVDVDGGAITIDKSDTLHMSISPIYKLYFEIFEYPPEIFPPREPALINNSFTGFVVLNIVLDEPSVRNYRFNTASYFGHSVNMMTVSNNGYLYLVGEFASEIAVEGGSTYDAGNTNNGFVISYDVGNNFNYFYNIGNDSAVVSVTGVTSDINNNIYAQGRFKKVCSIASFILTPSSQNFDSYLFKINSKGSFDWVNQLKSNNSPSMTYRMITRGNNIYSCFWTNGSSTIIDQEGNENQIFATNGRMFLTAFNSSGYLKWVTQFGKGSLFIYDKPNDITFDNQGLYLTGSFSGTSNFGNLTAVSNGS